MIKVKKLVKNYYTKAVETKVLKEIDLVIKKGEFAAIMGRSGAGKSTLLYQLGLLDQPTSGSIVIDKTDVSKLTNGQRIIYRLKNLGFVFQDFALVPELNAVENVMVPLIMQGNSKRKAFDLASKALGKVGLKERLHNLPSQLSGGEQQRVGVSRAFVHNPKIIFADEPTASLDSENAKEINNIFIKLHKKGQTIVLITHEPEDTVFVDRVITLSDGVVTKDVKKKSRKIH